MPIATLRTGPVPEQRFILPPSCFDDGPHIPARTDFHISSRSLSYRCCSRNSLNPVGNHDLLFDSPLHHSDAPFAFPATARALSLPLDSRPVGIEGKHPTVLVSAHHPFSPRRGFAVIIPELVGADVLKIPSHLHSSLDRGKILRESAMKPKYRTPFYNHSQRIGFIEHQWSDHRGAP